MPHDHAGEGRGATRSRLLAVLTGKSTPFGPNGEPSGIGKRPCLGKLYVQKDGIVGDEQGDKLHHGGVDKAIHHYAFDHYPAWRSDCPDAAGLFERPGTFGENFSSVGLTERNVCVGDIFQVGTAVLQVSQARQPCWKLNVRTSMADMAMKVQVSGRTGWYYRVIDPGWIRKGDEIRLLQRPNPEWPLQRVLQCLYLKGVDHECLCEMADLLFLSNSWRKLAQVRLERSAIEDWSERLDVPEKT